MSLKKKALIVICGQLRAARAYQIPNLPYLRVLCDIPTERESLIKVHGCARLKADLAYMHVGIKHGFSCINIR